MTAARELEGHGMRPSRGAISRGPPTLRADASGAALKAAARVTDMLTNRTMLPCLLVRQPTAQVQSRRFVFGRVSRRIVVASMSATALLACGYDWTVRDQPADAANNGDASSEAAATSDAGGDVAVPDGATHPGDASSNTDGAVLESGADATSSCIVLTQSLADARDRAQTCVQGSVGVCQAQVIDECGCVRYAAQAGSNEEAAWKDAITAFKNAACPPVSCPLACQTASTGTCLTTPKARCYP